MENEQQQEYTDSISWEALEFKQYEKGASWYAGVVIVAVATIGTAIWRKELFGTISLIAIAGLALYLLNKNPNRIIIKLTPKGIYQGEAFLPYGVIRNFWIVEAPHHRTLNLETTAYLNRVQLIELEEQDPELIRAYLSQFLQEHETRQETFAQKIMHQFKL